MAASEQPYEWREHVYCCKTCAVEAVEQEAEACMEHLKTEHERLLPKRYALCQHCNKTLRMGDSIIRLTEAMSRFKPLLFCSAACRNSEVYEQSIPDEVRLGDCVGISEEDET